MCIRDRVATGDEIAAEFGIPVVNKRVSVTPIALIGGVACHSTEDFVSVAKTLDKAAKTIGVNFIGGYSALVLSLIHIFCVLLTRKVNRLRKNFIFLREIRN